MFAAPAAAKTADGLTPSVETVCDPFDGRAYGLCNSYCEARDCDDPRVRASDRSCEVMEAHFRDLTGGDMPCAPTTPGECTLTLQNDTIVLEYHEQEEKLPAIVDVLANDTATGGTLEWRRDTIGQPDSDGNLMGQNSVRLNTEVDPLSSTYEISTSDSFRYTACCAAETCAGAMVTLTIVQS